jgi:nuclear transport factor 2 (NTF2) superfamily protein
MTPQELFEYKKSWLPGYNVQVDFDSDVWGKDWCRKRLERHQWSFDKYTMPDDSHTFSFENEDDADDFFRSYIEHNPDFYTK